MPSAPTIRCSACGSPTRTAERFCRSCGNDREAPVDLGYVSDEPATRTDVMADPGLGRLLSTADSAGAGQPAPPAPPAVSGNRRAGTLVVALGALLIVVGMVGSWAVIDGRIRPPAGAGGKATAGPTAGPTDGLPGSSSAPSTGPAGTSGTAEPTGLPGPVVVAPALQARPETPEVVALLGAYFRAIDERDFAALRRTLVPRAGLPTTAAEFNRRYKSTEDTDVRLLGLGTGPDGGLVASVSFTSHQAPADSPDGVSPCLRWSIAYPLVRVDGTLRIDEVGRSGVVHRRC